MRHERAERVVQVVSILLIWLAFAIARGFLGETTDKLLSLLWKAMELDWDCQGPTRFWIAIATNPWAFSFPVVSTAAITWLIWRRSPHCNWVTGALLCTAQLYLVIAIAAGLLPAYSLCHAP